MLGIFITAKNSSGSTKLILDVDKHENFFFTLLGKYRDQHIQIDFDALKEEEVEDIVLLLQARVGQNKERNK